MNFPPFSEIEVVMARSVAPQDHPVRAEPMTPERAAQALYAAGYRAIAASGTDRQLAIDICRAFPVTTRFGDALNSPSALQAVRYHLNRICAAAIAAPLDPEHIRAVQAESVRCARQMGGAPAPAAEAAE